MNKIEHYEIGKQKFKVPINKYIYKIADFGSVQILGSCMNTVTDLKIKRDLDQRVDLYDLSRIWYTILVNYISNDYGLTQIQSIIGNNDDYKQYYKNLEIKFKYNYNRNRRLLLSSIYYAIENNLINENEMIAKYDITKPSQLVLKTLNNLVNLDIKNVFDVFPMFRID